jgi:UDP-glucuronate decarboxylase
MEINFLKEPVLLTGCNGFLGNYFLNVLVNIIDANKEVKKTAKIIAIDNGITSSHKIVQRDYIQYYDENLIGFDFNRLKPIKTIVHMAGLASPAQYKKYPLETIDVAVGVTRVLLEKAKEWESKFIFFSSSEIYGNPDSNNVPTKETYKGYVSCQGPRACYDESKRLGETLCYIYNQYYNVHTNIIRPFNVYGPGMSKYDYRMIPNLMKSAIEGKPVQIYGDGKQTRTFCYISDAVDAIVRIVENGQYGETYNIGRRDPEISMVELIDTFRKSTGSNIVLELVDYPENYPSDEPLRRCPDISKVEEHLNYSPQISLEDGLRKTWQWANENYSC